MTKQELRNYTKMSTEITRLEDKIMEIETRLQSAKAPSLAAMPKGGPMTDMADKIVYLIDLKTLYEKKWHELIKERLRIENAINSLDNTIERALMGYKYIDGLTWEDVCLKIGYSWERTHYFHKQALKKLKKV